MDIKKILAFTIVVLAIFSCLNVASAGFLDFLNLGGGPQNETYTFDGFTLDLPANANITNNTTDDDGVKSIVYHVAFADGEGDNANTSRITVSTGTGESLVSSADEWAANWEAKGAKKEGLYNNTWTIVNINGVPMKFFQDMGINITYEGYILGYHNGNKIITIEGDDLAQIQKIADTFKPA